MTTAIRSAEIEPRLTLVGGRYRIDSLLSERSGVKRLRGFDLASEPPQPVLLLREQATPVGEPIAACDGSVWPSLAWEERLRQRCRHPGLPRLLGRCSTDGYNYLILESPQGIHLWDAWDEQGYGPGERFGWLIQIADMLQVLHMAGAVLENLRPDQLILTVAGQVVLADTGHLLPMPLPATTPILADFATAPELINGEWVDARSDLYCFGTLVYSLLLGRELADVDFDAPGKPKPYLERFPDIHPLLGRLMAKTLGPVTHRFPTIDVLGADPTGFAELIATLEQCQRVIGRARVELGAWSTTGMVRSHNEDAFAVVRACAGQSDLADDFALAVVADGMGGSAAGEVAAAMAVRTIQSRLSSEPPFAEIAGDPGATPPHVCTRAYADRIAAVLREANRVVYEASRQVVGRRGMGCTAEVVFTDGRCAIIGHVGDSRTYLFRGGELTLLTRDHSYVNRLLECGEISTQEAETHPRRAELQQAIGGWSDITPDVFDVAIEPGDWLLVCTDGLSNQLRLEAMQEILGSASCADLAARRLVNRANANGAVDNATAVVIRAV